MATHQQQETHILEEQEISQPVAISSLLQQSIFEETDAPHEIADAVNYIKKHIGFSGRYKYGYWLNKVKKSGFGKYRVTKLVDEAMALDPKYNKGGWLTNRLNAA